MEIRRYLTGSGRDVFGEWLAGLRDARTQAKIVARIDRLSAGNCGDCKALRAGLFELRVNWGPGYRVYYALVGRDRILLLCGGDKRRQPSDIKRALAYLKDYRERTP
jgi:putative addiction module killer protein